MKNRLGLTTRPTLTPAQTAAYLRHSAPLRNRLLILNVVLIGLFYMSYAVVDALLLGDVTTLSLALRFGVILPLAIALMIYLQLDRPIGRKELAATSVAVCGNIAWCAILVSSHSPGVHLYFYAAAIFQMVVTIGSRPDFRMALAASAVTLLVNYTAIWFINGVTAGYGLTHLAIYGPTVVLTLIACHQLDAERLTTFLQMHEIEILKIKLSQRADELHTLSITDPLTRLSNRRGTDGMLDALRRSPLTADLAEGGLAMIDIDHFKAFNDHHGHAAGDRCLARVAESLNREIAGEPIHLARHGGEEFVAILPSCNLPMMEQVAARLCQAIRDLQIEHAGIASASGHVTVSIGYACGSLETQKAFDQLKEAADRALYEVKANGRNGWRHGKVRSAALAA
ncbi:GGDEF domain-containing protein [Rhizobium halophytocola]|uniref:diguanylate cyclase n=1 Tax=Rhizobium halophytocola TaxID=735519 RepID=A0ABS4E5R0_9HYPH|nr:GGDEF domain-containing protein [Rhizobium halophytocola]MBP1853267.1 diguanylate cyclase (GGDEF)-like protein [Rhizobium halophytocola]